MTPSAYDVCGPLPTGTTVLEASAGTGKTFTLAALATRYVAEGHAALHELMAVTFSRAATQELRERVWERLASAERGLSDPAAARRDSAADPVLALLADAPADEVARRRRRLARALAGFDTATIATTHGFAGQMLAGLGLAADRPVGTTFVERVDELVAEVVDDLYLRKFTGGSGAPPLSRAEALDVALAAVADRHAQLVPDEAPPHSVPGLRVRLAAAVRGEVAVRKRAHRLVDYDDLLGDLNQALHDPLLGMTAVARVRARYRVVLVDEFQDTDPVQWSILRTAFHGHTTLVLVGDPKQAVYAFRGADVVTYLTATGQADRHATLARNWRSDAALSHALHHLIGGVALGDPRIVAAPLESAHPTRRLLDSGPPLRLRVLSRDDGKDRGTPAARSLIAADVAADVVGVLAGPARLTVDGAPRPLRPDDIAVLVRTNDQALHVRRALAERGVPAVTSGTVPVFATRAARAWLTLLRALHQPHRDGLVRAAALTDLVGWSAERLAGADEAAYDGLAARVRSWRDLLSTRGMAAVVEAVATSQRLAERLLARDGGERELTDLRHIGEILHAASIEHALGPSALVEWLRNRIEESSRDTAQERSRRLDTDADAVQVLTMHACKGLEFPVTYVPFGWDRWLAPVPQRLLLHDDAGARLLDVGGPDGPGYDERRTRDRDEQLGEDLRLLYVALTRGQCQVVVWWAPTRTTPSSPLHRLLFASPSSTEEMPWSVPVPPDRQVRERLTALAGGSDGTVGVEWVADREPQRWVPPPTETVALTRRTFTRTLDTAWRRTSYTGLTSGAHEPAVASEPEREERQDEPPADPAALPPAGRGDMRAPLALPSPLADLPAGPAFGTTVHRVLELLDPAAHLLAAALRACCEEVVGGRLSTGIDPGALAAGLLPVLATPLGPADDDPALRDISAGDRLTELDFELPLAGGDTAGTTGATLAGVADLLREHLPADDPLAGYADALDTQALRPQRLRGYLTGSLDAVLRLREDGTLRFVVVDYKTNWLGDPDHRAGLSAWHYRPAAMIAEMLRAHYPLQALLYAVALHRFLRWRQPAYDPHRHLGGVRYLFLRGMCGPPTPVVEGTRCGVVAWHPPVPLLLALSDLLDGSRT